MGSVTRTTAAYSKTNHEIANAASVKEIGWGESPVFISKAMGKYISHFYPTTGI